MEKDKSQYIITQDTVLWNDFRAGDEKSFDQIYTTYVQPLYKYGSKFTNDKELVLDCIQDLFEDLLIHLKTLGKTNNIKLYLFVSLRRKIIRSLRKENLIQLFQDDKLLFLSDYSVVSEISDSGDENEKINKLKNALEKLAPRQKEAIYLRFVSELEYEELSQIMGLNYQSVRNLICRAIEKLRKILVCLVLLYPSIN